MTVGPATGPQNSAYSPTLLSSTPVRMRLRSFPLLALAACRPAIPPDPAPPPAVALSAGTLRYALTDHRRVQHTVHGQTIITTATTRLVLAVSLVATDSGLAAEVLVESAALEGDAGGMAAAPAASGARITGHLGSHGSRFMRSAATAPHELLDQLTLSLHELLPVLPPGGALAETTWTDTTAVTGRAGGLPVTVTSHATSHAERWDRRDGNPVLPLRRSATYTLDGEGDPTGSWIILHGEGANHTRHLLDPAGAVVLAVCADTLRATIEVGATGLVIPVLQTRTDTLRRVTP
jgi:hypothetical protein